MNDHEDKKLYLIDAAHAIGTNQFTLRRWVRERRIPHYRMGRRLVFSRTDLNAFLQAHRIPAAERLAR